MNAVRQFIRRYPLSSFFIMAYTTSFGGYSLNAVFPSGWWILCVYGPTVAAFIVTVIAEGRTGLVAWLARIVRWRAPISVYAFALFVPVVLQFIAYQMNRALGATIPASDPFGRWYELLPEFAVMVLFIGLAEEPGFRGFALPRLLTGRSPLAASVVLGLLHTVWHFPLLVTGSEPIAIVPIILSGAILLTWLFLHANGSVLLPMLMHASVNTTAGYVGGLISDGDESRQTIILAAVYVAAALALIAISGANLGQKTRARTAHATAVKT